jgi:hypothetical protein
MPFSSVTTDLVAGDDEIHRPDLELHGRLRRQGEAGEAAIYLESSLLSAKPYLQEHGENLLL